MNFIGLAILNCDLSFRSIWAFFNFFKSLKYSLIFLF